MATLQLISDFAGRTIGNWSVDEKLGEGGFGVVYRAHHQTLEDRVAAIKLLKPEALHDPTLIERFRNEARAAARVKHPGIVRIYDIGEHAETGAHYIIMEYLRGKDLQQWLAPHREGLPLAEVLELLYDVGDVLDAVHDERIIHRDLKPENLFRQEDGQVKLLDLGIAKLTPDLAGSFRTATNIVLGSPGYFAPELADPKRSAAIDRRSDVFSLAAVAYELITHDRAWHFKDPWHYVALIQKADRNRPRDPRILRPEMPVGWSRAIMAGLSKDPDDRPEKAGAFVAELADSFHGGGEIVARRADAIRAAGGLPPKPARTSPPATSTTDERRSRTPVIDSASARSTTPAPTPAPPATDRAAEHDPSRVPTLTPDRIPTRVPTLTPDRIPTLVAPTPPAALPPDRVPTLVATPRVPTGAVPELLAQTEGVAAEPLSDTRPIASIDRRELEDARPAAIVASGMVAASPSSQPAPARHVESGSVMLDPALAAVPIEPPTTPPSAPEIERTTTPLPSTTTAATRPAIRRMAVAGAAAIAVVAVVVLVVVVRGSRVDSSAATPPNSAATVDAAPVALAMPIDAAAPPVDARPAAPIDASEAPADAAPPAPPDAGEKPRHAPRGEGTVAVYANEMTDVFVVSGSRAKFLGTTPLPRASVPAGTVTLELRSRGRKTTRKVTVRPGRKARVDHTWSN